MTTATSTASSTTSTAHEPTSAARGAAGWDEFCPRTTAAEQRDSRDERHAERASRRRAEDVRRARLERRRTSARPPSDYLGRMAAA
jgi:hypothetical protein